MTHTYRVLLSGVLAGHLHRNQHHRIAFHFAPAYQRMPERPVLGQKFEDNLQKPYPGQTTRLPPFFANLVPEPGPLRTFQEGALGIPPDDDLAFLSAVGADLPGALEVLPGEAAIEFTAPGSEPETPDDAPEGAPEDGLRFSLAGVQMKFSVLLTAEKPTLPGTGELGGWIVKLDSARFPQLVQNEFATMEWARTAGFEVPECRLAPTAALPPRLRELTSPDGQIYLIRRYDRHAGQRIHQEDFTQVVGLYPGKKYDEFSYEQLAGLVRAIVGEAGYDEFIRRLVLMVASGNGDAHLKNWSLLYPDGQRPVLTPLYDQVATIAWPELAPAWALHFAGTKKVHLLDEAAFQRLITLSGGDPVRTGRLVATTLAELADAWHRSVAPQVMPAAHIARLRQHWERVPLLKPHAAAIAG